MKLLFDIIGAAILSISTIYIMSTILELSVKKNGLLKYIISVILLSIYLIISYHSTMIFLRYLLFIFIMSLIITTVFKKTIKETLIASAFTWIISVVSELIFAIIVVFALNMQTETFYGMLLGNIGISLILVLIIKIPRFNDILKKSLNKIDDSEKYYSVLLIIILSLSISIIVYINYFDTSSKMRFIFSLGVIITYTTITMILFKEKSNGLKMQYEYEAVLKNLNEYEKMLDYQKVANHENKNQLLVLKGMLVKHDKKLDEYIDSIISERKEDDEDFFYKTNLIPSGGLRGLVYYKLLAMKDKNIKVDLKIESKIRKVKLENLCISVNKDICKIVGVILDNAIQAVENLEQKNIDIEMKKEDNKFIITVSNNFDGLIDLVNIESSGYTTKGNGHGYGLTLMKQLVDKNEIIENKRYIYGNMFVQKIIIEI